MKTPAREFDFSNGAYEEMQAAVKVILGKIKEYPSLLDQLLAEVEIALITIALEKNGNNCAKAARFLGINRPTLVEKRRKYKMPLQQLKWK